MSMSYGGDDASSNPWETSGCPVCEDSHDYGECVCDNVDDRDFDDNEPL